MPTGAQARWPKEAREPPGLELVDRDGTFDAAGLVPDAEADVRIFVEVPRHTQRFPCVARMGGKELDQLAAKRRGAPWAVAKPPLDAAPALSAGLHAHSLT